MQNSYSQRLLAYTSFCKVPRRADVSLLSPVHTVRVDAYVIKSRLAISFSSPDEFLVLLYMHSAVLLWCDVRLSVCHTGVLLLLLLLKEYF